MKLLCDIYRMRIMEGDVIRTIRDNINWIGHFSRNGGVPGQHGDRGIEEWNAHAHRCRHIADAKNFEATSPASQYLTHGESLRVAR